MMNKKEEAILVAATRLFSQFGYHAVGVDLIIKEANVAKMTFYKFFPSKNILIQKTLIRRSLFLQTKIICAVDDSSTSIDKIKSIFSWYEEWTTRSDFNGCMFIKASEQFPCPDNTIKQAVKDHKQWLTAYIIDLLDDLNITNIHKIARYIVVVLEGLSVNINMSDTKKMTDLHFSWQCVKQLIEFNQKSMMA